MKIAFSADHNGTILVAYNPDALNTAETSTVYVPQPGENHVVADVPAQLQGKNFADIAKSFRVTMAAGKPVFQPFQEPR